MNGLTSSIGGSAASAGIEFENSVAAWIAVWILSKDLDAPRQFGVPVGTEFRRITCQASEYVDDVVVETVFEGTAGQVFLQAKRSVRSLKSAELASTLRQFALQHHRLKVSSQVGPHSVDGYNPQNRYALVCGYRTAESVRVHLANVLARPRSANASFLESTRNAQERHVAQHVISELKKAWVLISGNSMPDEEAERLVSCMRVIPLSVEESGSDRATAVRALRGNIVADDEEAEHAWNCLLALASRLARTRSSVDAAYLQRNLREAGLSLRAQGATRPRTNPVKFLPDNLPTGYVSRRKAVHQLRQALIRSSRQEVGVVGHAALVGEGGLGKTVLARAICDDPEVQRRFPDGILWASVGQTPDPALHQRNWIASLNGDQSAAFNLISGKAELNRLLSDSSVLLILDDIWRQNDINPLRVGGSRCRILITTRDATQIPDAELIRLDRMQSAESRALLRRYVAHRTLPTATLDSIAERLAHLPLALRIVGAMIRSGIAWGDIQDALGAGDLAFVSYGQSSVLAAMDASVQFLSNEDRTRYRSLAVLPRQEALTEEVAARLWAAFGPSSLRTIRRKLAEFVDRSLIQADHSLHDLQHDYLTATVSEEERRERHASLVRGYADGADWGTFEVASLDDYGWRHLGHHMHAAGDLDALQHLLRNNSYVEGKIGRLGTAALLRDLALLPENAEFREWVSALRSSAHVLDREPAQLHNELFGRLRQGPFLVNRAPAEGVRLELQSRTLLRRDTETFVSAKGHSGAITSCVFCPDGVHALTASIDGTLRLWDMERGVTVKVLIGHTDQVRGCAVSRDGALALSASLDGTIRLWSLPAGEAMATIEGQGVGLRACAFSPQGDGLASADDNGLVQLWWVDSRRTIGKFDVGGGPIHCCSFSPDGVLLALGSEDGKLRILNTRTGRLNRLVVQHAGPVRGCSFDPTGALVATTSGDRSIRITNVRTGVSRTLDGHQGAVTCCAFGQEGRSLLSSGWDRSVRLWDLATGEATRIMNGHKGSVNSCDLSPNGRLALSGSWDCSAGIWDLRTGDCVRTLPGEINYVRACAYSPDGELLARGSDDGTITIMNARSMDVIASHVAHADYIRKCVFTPDSRHLLTASDDKTMKLWRLNPWQPECTYYGHDHWVRACMFFQGGTRILSASWDKTLRVWDTETGRTLAVLTGHTDGVTDCAVTPDGLVCVSASEDRTVKLWDITSGVIVRTFEGHSDFVRACAIAPNGRRIASASVGGEVYVWDVENGKDFELVGHRDYVRGCSFLGNGAYLLTVSDDNTARLWACDDRREIARWSADASLMCCAVSPAEHDIVIGDSLSNVHFLRVAGLS